MVGSNGPHWPWAGRLMGIDERDSIGELVSGGERRWRSNLLYRGKDATFAGTFIAVVQTFRLVESHGRRMIHPLHNVYVDEGTPDCPSLA